MSEGDQAGIKLCKVRRLVRMYLAELATLIVSAVSPGAVEPENASQVVDDEVRAAMRDRQN